MWLTELIHSAHQATGGLPEVEGAWPMTEFRPLSLIGFGHQWQEDEPGALVTQCLSSCGC